MKILLIGGTRFLGRWVVERALERGHEVTLFHRGRTQPGLFPSCERIVGSRESDLNRLDGRSWDAVVDTCGFYPRALSDSVGRLRDRVEHYTFVSSISVYAEPVAVGADESAPLALLADPTTEAVTGETYGGLKAASERMAESLMPGRVLHVRAGLLVGPWDYTNRFSYWVRRLVEGGDVLVPDALDQPLQLIDARDAASWIVAMAEQRAGGTFNVTGPESPTTLGAVLEGIRSALASSARLVPVGTAFLKEQKVEPWSEMPLWAPDSAGFLAVRIDRARAQGLAFRPLEATARDTWDWLRSNPEAGASGTTLATPVAASLARERERDLLSAWSAR